MISAKFQNNKYYGGKIIKKQKRLHDTFFLYDSYNWRKYIMEEILFKKKKKKVCMIHFSFITHITGGSIFI